MAKKQVVITAEQVVEVVAVEQVVEVKKPKVGDFIISLILKGDLTNAQILEEVQKEFAEFHKVRQEKAKPITSYACIAWYKSKLRKEGKIGARVFAKKVKVEANDSI